MLRVPLQRQRRTTNLAINQSVCALRFFYGVTLQKDWDIERIPYQKTGRTLPVLRAYGKADRPRHWLFPGQDPDNRAGDCDNRVGDQIRAKV